MNKTDRDRIFSNLVSALGDGTGEISEAAPVPVKVLGQDEKIKQLTHLLEAVRSEVYWVRADTWMDQFKQILVKKGVKSLLYAPWTGRD